MNTHTIARCLRASALLALSAPAGAAAAPVTLRVISQLGTYSQPAGIVEGAPGLLYFIGGADIVSVTPRGSIVPLTGFRNPPYIVKSPPVSGANRRIYSSVETNGGANSAYAYSVGAAPGYHAYGTQAFSQAFTQNLPDGNLLTLAYRFSDASTYLAKTDPDGNVMPPIYRFPSGERPGTYDNAIYATDGNYYGSSVTADKSAVYVYRITPSGALTKLLSLPNPVALYLLEAGDGNLYGVTGANTRSQTGTIFKLTLGGEYTLLHAFRAGAAGNLGRLMEGSDGKLYGAIDGSDGSDLYSITTSGQYSILYNMRSADGRCPCTLAQGSDGIVYGTALSYGTTGGGTIFALDAGLPKPAPRVLQFSPTSGTVGTKVRIWGQNLLSASVEFNGMAAKEAYSSGPNYAWATVPKGAKTGPIEVRTPGGRATTRASFAVR